MTAEWHGVWDSFLILNNSSPAQGFLPSSRSRHGHERSVSVVYFALVVIQLAALTTFFVYGVLSYRAGMNLAQRLELSYPAVQDQVSDVRNSAHGLQGVINGTQRIAGSSMSSAFEPSPPDLDSPSQVSSIHTYVYVHNSVFCWARLHTCCVLQAMINDLETVNSVASGSVRKLERVYEALLAFIGVSAFVTLIFLLLAGGGMNHASLTASMISNLMQENKRSKLVHCTDEAIMRVFYRLRLEEPQVDARMFDTTSHELHSPVVLWGPSVRSATERSRPVQQPLRVFGYA